MIESSFLSSRLTKEWRTAMLENFEKFIDIVTNMANWGNVTATDSTCKSIGGLAGESLHQ